MARIDCNTKGDRCEGQTCELSQVCLALSDDDQAYCFPKECAFDDDDDWDLLKKKKKLQSKKRNTKKYMDCITKGDYCHSNINCEIDQVCIANDDETAAHCFPQECAADDELLLKRSLKTKKSHTHGHHNKEMKVALDCRPYEDCEESGDCELGEVCHFDEEYYGACYLKECFNEFYARKTSTPAKTHQISTKRGHSKRV